MNSEVLQLRVYGDSSQKTLVYLPGLHGDWTLIGGFRKALQGRLRFGEVTYPRSLTWSLEDYASGVEQALAAQGITGGWLLGESFGSQVVWSMAARKQFKVQGVILAGGFVRHPMRLGVKVAEGLFGNMPLRMLTRIMFGYARFARFRYRRSKETMAGVNEFIARRTELDRQAGVHRLRLVAKYDPCPVAQQLNVPVYAIAGLVDPIVPWFRVRWWLKKNCPQMREFRIVTSADHNVLGTAPDISAEQVLQWLYDS